MISHPGTGTVTSLIDSATLAARVESLAAEIVADLGSSFTMVVVLKGAFVFAADLLRALGRAGASVRVEFIRLSSYGDARHSSGQVRVLGDMPDVSGQAVLVVEDVVDTGRSACAVLDLMHTRGARQVSLAALLDKPSHRVMAVDVAHIGFSIGDHFVVGYGIDHAERHRERPDLAVLGEP